MFSLLFRKQKSLQFIRQCIRPYCNSNPSGPIVTIDGKCYVPVPCPQVQQPEITFTRIVRGQPPKVRLGFIPENWFEFFHQKTGITGPYVFMVSISTFLMSKEIYVMEHEYYTILPIIVIMYVVTSLTKVGSSFAKSIDKAIDAYELKWMTARNDEKNDLENSIAYENKLQKSMEGQFILQEAKKENVHLQLEQDYRIRLMTVYKGVKRRLDFQVTKTIIEKKFLHRNLIEWVVDQVIAGYTDETEKKNFDNCLDYLSTLAPKYKSQN